MPSMQSPVPTILLGGSQPAAAAQPSSTCGSAPYMPVTVKNDTVSFLHNRAAGARLWG